MTVVEKWFNIGLTIWFIAIIKAFIIGLYIQYYTHLNVYEILRQVMLTYKLHGYLDNTHIHLLYNNLEECTFYQLNFKILGKSSITCS